METTRPTNIFVRIKRMFKKTKKVTPIDRFRLIDDFRHDVPALGNGSYGTYYLKDNIGHKVFHYSVPSNVEKEFDNLKKAHDMFPHLFPKPYELIKIRDEVNFSTRYGYTMEHIDMSLLRNSNFEGCENINREYFLGLLKDVLWELGIEHRDLHASNVMYSRETGNFKIIDADPTFLSINDKEAI